MIYGKTNCEFEIHSHYEVWGFTIAVKDLQGNHIAEYDLSQVTGMAPDDHGTLDTCWYSSWGLLPKGSLQYEWILTGRLTYKTDPFAPLQIVLKFLEKKHGDQ
tara:strand:- start:3636 stop:3944 length:309 start_codon:yes stop_codon:yes gene_type:complete